MAKPKKPTDPPDDDEVTDDEVEFTPAQLRVMNNTISAAVSAQLGRKLKPVQDQLGELSTMRESIDTLAKTLGGGGAGAGAGAAGAGGAAVVAPKDDPEIKAMRARVEAMETAAKEKEIAARNRDRDSRLTSIATSVGVDKNRIRGAVSLLKDQVSFDKEGNAIMKVQRGGFDEDVDIETGASEFFKTDEGKSYLAPQQALRGGSGQRTSTTTVVNRGAGGANNNPSRGAQQEKAGKKAEAANALADAVGELIGGGNINLG